METSRVDQLYGVFDSQVFWGFITLILAAAAFSGKLNMNASAACLALAWVVGCVGIYKSDAIRDWYLMIAIWLALGAILAMLASWFQPSVPKKETTGSKSLFVREIITASHLEGNAIVLTDTPDPESVRLMLNGASYVPQTSQGPVVRGRKIFLENIPGDVPLLDIIREEVHKGSIIVEYSRDPSAKGTDQQTGSILRQQTSLAPVLLKKQISSPGQREQIRWEIKPFITRGYDVLHLYESHLLADKGVWQEWVQEVSDFLRESLGESYVDYWGNHNGLKPFWSPLPVAVPERNRKLYADTFYRLKRLGEIHESLKG